jgi:hypothetical protein
MAMNETIQKFMKRHCSKDLFFEIMYDDVFPPITSTINADRLIQETDSEFRFDAMKFAFVFEKAGGTIIRNGERIGAQSLLESIDYYQSGQIRRQWDNSIANGDIPFYDMGPLEEIVVAPRFIPYRKQDGTFGIKKLMRIQPDPEGCSRQYKDIQGESSEDQSAVEQRIIELGFIF